MTGVKVSEKGERRLKRATARGLKPGDEKEFAKIRFGQTQSTKKKTEEKDRT